VGRPSEEKGRDLFAKTLVVRQKGDDAGSPTGLFETLVRVHRAGEARPTQASPEGPVEPAIKLADQALRQATSRSS
jgi:hypothetical protein